MTFKINNTVVIDNSRNGYFNSAEVLSPIAFGEATPGFQGTVSGYTSGGVVPVAIASNIVDKFPFSTDANATDVGDLTVARRNLAGQSSTVSGYTSGGYSTPPATTYNVIDRFPFATNANATDVGDLTTNRNGPAGQSSSVSGYSSGGPTTANIIDAFPFATNSNASDVGDLTAARAAATGQSSPMFGYTSGGFLGPAVSTNIIDKFPFAANANAADVGDLTFTRFNGAGQSSFTAGYTSGGSSQGPSPPAPTNTIDKFPFATDANATDVGDLTVGRTTVNAGQSSTVSGYSSGGYAPFLTPSHTNIIDKFPFSTNANATDVGDLTQSKAAATGQQY